MSWYGWLLLAVSLIGYVWGWRLVVRQAIEEIGPGYEWVDIVLCMLFSTIFALLWPLFTLGCFARWTVRAHTPEEFAAKLAGRSRAQKREDREREAYLRELEIKRLEREVGIPTLED